MRIILNIVAVLILVAGLVELWALRFVDLGALGEILGIKGARIVEGLAGGVVIYGALLLLSAIIARVVRAGASH